MVRRFIIGTFKSETALLEALRVLKNEGLTVRDTYTPYAVHGLPTVVGIPESRIFIPIITAIVIGCCVAIGFQYWAFVINWPVVTGGKTGTLLPSFIPITFEITVLFGGLTAVAAFFLRSRLFWGKGPRFKIAGVTDDCFALVLEEVGGLWDATKIRDLLLHLGALNVEERVQVQ